MSGRYLLDTTSVIALFRRDAAALDAVAGAELLLSSIVLGELYYGAEQSANRDENVRQIQRFARGVRVLPCDHGTGRMYARIKNDLRAKGRMIPQNDVWIAATAVQHELGLVARDQHFEEVAGLHTVSW